MKKTILRVIALIAGGTALAFGGGFLLGKTVGGDPHGLFLITIPISFLFAFFAVYIIFGKEKFKEKKAPWAAVIVIAIISFIVINEAYSNMNVNLASSDYTEYKTTVTHTMYGRTHLFEVYFDDLNGNEGMDSVHTMKYVIEFDEENSDRLEEGDEITVREYKGGFGYPVYRIQELNDLR